MVELSAVCQNVVRRAHRAGVAGAVEQRFISKAQRILNAQALGLLFADLFGHGHEILPHRGAEGFDVLLVVAVALHSKIPERYIIVKSQFFRHTGANGNELIVDLVQLFAVGGIPRALRDPGAAALGVVLALLEGRHLRQGIGAALKFDLCRGQQVGILDAKQAFLLHIGHDFRRKTPGLQFEVQEHHLAVLLLEVLAEGAGQQRLLPGVGAFAQHGASLGQLARLFVVKSVGAVDIVADLRNGRHGGVMLFLLLHLEEGFVRLFKGLRIPEALGLLGIERLGLVQIRTGIGHLRELDHGVYAPSTTTFSPEKPSGEIAAATVRITRYPSIETMIFLPSYCSCTSARSSFFGSALRETTSPLA